MDIIKIKKDADGIMSRESFIEVINTYKSMWDFMDELNDLFQKYQICGEIYPPMCIETVIYLLEYIFDDKDQWITYWILWLDFGEDYEGGDVTDANGNIISLKTAEDLYDLLVKNISASKEETDE